MAAPTPQHERSDRSVENLIARYAELVDAGDFGGLGELFADGVFGGEGDAVVGGQEAVEKIFRAMVRVYEDGTPRTKHVTTNIRIEVDDDAGTAESHSYVTVFQALPGMAMQPIVAGRYRDVFVPVTTVCGDLPSDASRPTSSVTSVVICWWDPRFWRHKTPLRGASPPIPDPSARTQPTMREVSMTGRGWISMIRMQLLASETVEGDGAVTVRELHVA